MCGILIISEQIDSRRTFGSRKTATTPSPTRCSAAWPTQQRWRRGLDTGGYKSHNYLCFWYFNNVFHYERTLLSH